MNMRKKVALLLLGAMLLIAAAGCGGAAEPEPSQPAQPTQTERQPEPSPSPEPPQPVAAPDFTVYDLEGNEVHLSDFFGKPIVLNFWASWCGPCKSEMPAFQAAFEVQGEEIQFLLINVTGGRESVKTASKFIEKEGYTFPVFYDTNLEASTLYGASSLPITFFIDAEGYAIAYAIGALSTERLQMGLDTIT